MFIRDFGVDHNELISFNQKQLNYVIRYYRSTHCSVFSYIKCMILVIFLHSIYQLIWFVNCWQWHDVCSMILTSIYIIISQNIRYLLWNRGFCRSLNNTYPIFLTPCIRCTNHLCDSCDLTDVNPHFIPSLLRKIQNVDLLWRHRY